MTVVSSNEFFFFNKVLSNRQNTSLSSCVKTSHITSGLSLTRLSRNFLHHDITKTAQKWPDLIAMSLRSLGSNSHWQAHTFHTVSPTLPSHNLLSLPRLRLLALRKWVHRQIYSRWMWGCQHRQRGKTKCWLHQCFCDGSLGEFEECGSRDRKSRTGSQKFGPRYWNEWSRGMGYFYHWNIEKTGTSRWYQLNRPQRGHICCKIQIGQLATAMRDWWGLM